MAIKRVTLMIFGDDSNLRRVLDDVERRKKEISNDIEIKIGISNYTLLRAELDELKRKLDELERKSNRIGSGGGSGRGGLFGRLFGGSNDNNSPNRILKSINTLIAKIPVVGTALSQLSPASIPLIVAAFVALSAAIGGIIGPLAAATMGFGSLVALSLPALKEIQKGVHAVDSASTAMARNKAWSAIPAYLRPAVKDVIQIKDEFGKMSKALAPLIGQIAHIGLEITNKLLPSLLPFARSAGHALAGLLKQFDKFASSPGFKSFMATMLKWTGPSLTTIGQGIGQVAAALGDVFKELANPQSIIILRGLFIGLAGAIKGIGWWLRISEKAIFAWGSVLLKIAQVGLDAVKSLGDAFLWMTATTLHAMSHIPGLGFLKDWADAVDSWRTSFDGQMNGAISTVKRWQDAWKNAPKVVALQANIQNLQARLATARQLLGDPNLTKTRRSRIEANIANLLRNIAIAKAQLAGLDGSRATVFVDTVMQAVGAGVGASTSSGSSGGGSTGGGGGPHVASASFAGAGDSGDGSSGGPVMMSSLSTGPGDGGGHGPPGHKIGHPMKRIRTPIMQPGGGLPGTTRWTGIWVPRRGGPFAWHDHRLQHNPHGRHHGRDAVVHIHFNGVVTNPKAVAKEIQTMLLNLKRGNGGGDLGLA